MLGTSKHGSDPVDDAARQTASAKVADKKVMTLTRVCVLASSLIVALGAGRSGSQRSDQGGRFDLQISDNSQRMMKEGKQIFRFDTFGDETYWSGKLRLHDAIQGSKFGGVG